MDIRPEIQIQSMVKAMIDVVLPAVDPAHKMAQEQARLIIGTLQLIAQRLPIAYRYDCDELRRYVALAHALLAGTKETLDPDTQAELARLATQGRQLLTGACSEPADVEAAAFALRAAVSHGVQQACSVGSTQVKQAVRRLVLDAAKIELERERSLVMGMGFETDVSKRPRPIEEQLPPPTAVQ